MNFDFPTIMLTLTVVTGVIWAIDIKLWKPKRVAEAKELEVNYTGADKDEVVEKAYKEPIFVEYARSFFPVILIVLLLRSFLVEPFRIPSGSMIPTLKVGDFILVNKFTYGIRLPVFHTKIFSIGEPHRGDVVVFRYPKDPSVDYIKRLIGLPGDHIAYRNHQLYINGKPVKREKIGPYMETKNGLPIPGAELFKEQITRDLQHDILHETMYPTFDKDEWVVPPHHYFMMGDNRDNSNDSRFWGFVPEENLVGKAFMIWMNWDFKDGGIEWSRIGDSIH